MFILIIAIIELIRKAIKNFSDIFPLYKKVRINADDITKENIVIIHEVLKAVISVIIPKIRIYDSTKTFIFVSLEVGPKYKKIISIAEL